MVLLMWKLNKHHKEFGYMEIAKQDILNHLQKKYPNSTKEGIEHYYNHQSYNSYWDKVSVIKSKYGVSQNEAEQKAKEFLKNLKEHG